MGGLRDSLRHEPCVNAYFRFEQFGNGAARLRVFHRRIKLRFVGSGNMRDQIQMAFCYGKSVRYFFQRNRRCGFELARRHPGIPQLRGKRHSEASGVAAASSSSGFVPTPFSKRVLKEYCVCLSTPLSVEIVPLPSFNPPCHTAEPLRCMVSLLFFHFIRWIPGIRFIASPEEYISWRALSRHSHALHPVLQPRLRRTNDSCSG